MNNNFYCVSGYGWSGSGAVVDLLKEFENFKAINVEYPLIGEPFGLIDLEIFLVQNWHFLRHDMAIKNFKSFCQKLNKKKSVFNATGLDISTKLSIDFEEECQYFLDELVEFSYQGRTRINLYSLSKLAVFIMKFKWKFFDQNSTQMNLANPTSQQFISSVQKFHANIFRNLSDNGKNSIILDQAIPVNNMYRSLRYLPNSKLIIVDRDPRDIYADLVRSKGLIGPEICKFDKASVDKFIIWHKSLRKTNSEFYNATCEKNILKLNFEDVIFNYKNSVTRISNFIGEEIQHKKPLAYFKPDVSIKNIGIWKQVQNQNHIEIIKDSIKYQYND